MKKIVWMICTVSYVGSMAAEVVETDSELIEQVGYVEEEGDVANNDSRERNDINFYDKNREAVKERRRREAIRAWRELQRQQVCCPEGERPVEEKNIAL